MTKEVEKKAKKERKHFLKDFKAELKKVIWPTPKQVANNTIAVITIVLITAVIVFALDLIFGEINTHGIDNIRKLVRNENTINNEINATGENKAENTNAVEENEASTDVDNSVENSSVQE